ncbi:MAG: XdhC family protein [Candidatus Bathyarchaeia archaeon]
MGVGDEELKPLHAPVGLNIGARTPEEIAISIIAEIIAERRKA